MFLFNGKYIIFSPFLFFFFLSSDGNYPVHNFRSVIATTQWTIHYHYLSLRTLWLSEIYLLFRPNGLIANFVFFFIYPNRNLFHGYESNTYINKHGINIIGKSVALKWSQIWPKVVSCWRKMGKSRQRKNCCWIFHLIKLTWISAGIWTDLLNGRQTLTWYT